MRHCHLKFALILVMLSGPAYCQSKSDCTARPIPIESPNNVRSFHLMLVKYNHDQLLEGNCYVLNRLSYGDALHFNVIDRFSDDVNTDTGYLFIKSLRTFSNQPVDKIALSRGGGWAIPNAHGEFEPIGKWNDQPYVGSVATWNASHSQPGDPVSIDDRLHTKWHAYAGDNGNFPSTNPIDFWKIKNVDLDHMAVTNYLIRFDVNKGAIPSRVKSYVDLQPEVRRIDLIIYSNIQLLGGSYTFIMK
jgi:hypothetical protein